MPVLTVTHTTTYRYASPVTFGEHRMMMRPRDSHDLRLLETSLILRPAAKIRWIHDVFSNSVAIARFSEPATELHVQSTFRAEHFPLAEGGVEIEAYARHHPPPRCRISAARRSGIIRMPNIWSMPGRGASWKGRLSTTP